MTAAKACRAVRRPVSVVVAAIFFFLSMSLLAVAADVRCERVVAVGDLHGGYDPFLAILREADLIDADKRWKGGADCLVQLGDIVDRGDRSRELLDFLMELERQASGRVHILLGNHEVMNVLGDLRYAAPGEFNAFAEEEKQGDRKAGYKAFRRLTDSREWPPEEQRAEFERQFPPGWFAHRKAFSPEGRYGQWLLSKPALVVIERTLFVHGGLSPRDAERGIDSLNSELIEEVRGYLRLGELLVENDVLNPLVPFGKDFPVVEAWLGSIAERPAGEQPSEVVSQARRFLEKRDAIFIRSDGPIWDRALATADEESYRESVERILEAVGADRIVVGHTTQESGRIASRFDNRVFLIDTGAGPAYEGEVSALEIRGNEVREVYAGEPDPLVESTLGDPEIERFLLEADVIEREYIGVGVTRPEKLLLSMNGLTRKAAFKTVDIHDTGVTRLAGVEPEINFTDSYTYERAAYLIDRELGMHMVPTAVFRRIGGDRGAVIDWIPDSVSGADLHEKGERLPHSYALVRQRWIMNVFDALIGNIDRNLSNQLITPADGKLYLIDHSRSFRANKKLRKEFLEKKISVPRSLVERLEALEEGSLRALLKGVVPTRMTKVLLARRDRILEKIARDRERYGDDEVLY